MTNKTLTRKFLSEDCHVTGITSDGKFYVNGRQKKTHTCTAKHSYGNDTTYEKINLYYTDKDGNSKQYSTTVARAMLAWFTGSISRNEDADHIDRNKLNNRITNLRKISRRENLLNRALSQKEINSRYWAIRRELETEPGLTKKEILAKYYEND